MVVHVPYMFKYQNIAPQCVRSSTVHFNAKSNATYTHMMSCILITLSVLKWIAHE